MIKRILMVWSVALSACTWALTAAAQQPPPLSQLLPKVDATEAVESPYGMALIDHFAKIIATSADAACTKSRKLDDAAFHKGARDLLVGYAPGVQDIIGRILDSPEFAQQLAGASPPIAVDELRAVLSDEIIKQRVEFLLHDHIAILLDVLTEKIDQASVLEKLLKGRISTTGSGEKTLLKIVEQRIEETDYAMDLFDKANPSPNTARFKEIWLKWPLILAKSAGSGQWSNVRPADYVPGLKGELGKLCVGQP